MNTDLRCAGVYVRERFAGVLAETEAGYRFTYDPEYLNDASAPAASLTLPRQDKPFFSKTLFPFFDGLIPEGWLLDIVVHNWKIDRRDRFALLLAACRDCIGCVSIREIEWSTTRHL